MPTEASLPFSATVDEASRLTGLTRTDLYDLLRAGTIEAVKRGRKTLILMDTLRRHLLSQRRATFGAGRSEPRTGMELKRSKRAAMPPAPGQPRRRRPAPILP